MNAAADRGDTTVESGQAAPPPSAGQPNNAPLPNPWAPAGTTPPSTTRSPNQARSGSAGAGIGNNEHMQDGGGGTQVKKEEPILRVQIKSVEFTWLCLHLYFLGSN